MNSSLIVRIFFLILQSEIEPKLWKLWKVHVPKQVEMLILMKRWRCLIFVATWKKFYQNEFLSSNDFLTIFFFEIEIHFFLLLEKKGRTNSAQKCDISNWLEFTFSFCHFLRFRLSYLENTDFSTKQFQEKKIFLVQIGINLIKIKVDVNSSATHLSSISWMLTDESRFSIRCRM